MRVPLHRVSGAVLAILVAAGCAEPAPTTTPAPSVEPSAQPSIAIATTAPESPELSGLITIEPPVTLIDEPVAIRLTGFPPKSEVTVRATTVGTAFPDKAGVRTSAATFRTDEHGTVDLTTATPVSGSYGIANAMGLFWSMESVAPGEVTTTASPPPDSPDPQSFETYRYEITAEVEGRAGRTGDARPERRSRGRDDGDVSADGMLGQFYLPAGAGPFPAVIIVAGSDGGLSTRRPRVLAAHGYAVLSLAYIRYKSPVDGTKLPDETIDLPLEYFGKAISWLQDQQDVDPDRIGMFGTSLGGDVAMLVAARYPEIKSVIAITPPTATWDGGPATRASATRASRCRTSSRSASRALPSRSATPSPRATTRWQRSRRSWRASTRIPRWRGPSLESSRSRVPS